MAAVTVDIKIELFKISNSVHCKNEYALSHQKKCGNRLQAILLTN